MPNAREVGIGAGVIAGVTALAVAGVPIARAMGGGKDDKRSA